MDANQRSEINNQTSNGANEKWTPGATGKSAENGAPLDHTYPQGLGVQQGNQQRDMMGTQQSGSGPGAQPGGMGGRANDNDAGIPGGSMETQINGGSGTVQGITDSHQRQAEQKSWAYGMLEQPVGHRPHDSGVNLHQERTMQHDNTNQGGNMQQGVAGSRAGADQQSDAGGVHESNDVAGGLPRSPGNSGASTDRAGSQTGAGGRDAGTEEVHDSNDAAGGYPRSPGYANRLAGDSNMDDDTGFKRKP